MLLEICMEMGNVNGNQIACTNGNGTGIGMGMARIGMKARIIKVSHLVIIFPPKSVYNLVDF